MPVYELFLNQIKNNDPDLQSIDLEYALSWDTVYHDITVLFDALSNNTTVTSLNLEGNEIYGKCAKIISKSLVTNTTLTSLNLSYTRIGEFDDAEAFYLAEVTTLRSLNLRSTHIGDEDAKNLAKNTTLTSLDLSCCELTYKGVKALAKNTTLTSLVLESVELTDKSIEALANNTTLTSLNLSYCNLTYKGIKALADNNTLTSELTGKSIEALANNTTLTSLNLSYCNLTYKGIKALADNNTLTSLNLRFSEITDEGAIALATNNTLTSLNLIHNPIFDQGVDAFRQALKWNHRLLMLEMDDMTPDMDSSLQANRERQTCLHHSARELLTATRTLLLGTSSQPDKLSPWFLLPLEMKLIILHYIPESGLLDSHQEEQVIQYALKRTTLGNQHDFSFFLKATSCEFFVLPTRKRERTTNNELTALPPHKKQKTTSANEIVYSTTAAYSSP